MYFTRNEKRNGKTNHLHVKYAASFVDVLGEFKVVFV